MAKALQGPSREALQQPADALIVLVHGYGASGDDLIDLAAELAPILPRAAFVAPHAQQHLPGQPMAGYQWFSLASFDPGDLAAGAAQAGPNLDAYIDAELTRRRIMPERLALVGFSQGTMMALQVGLRRTVLPAAIVGFSGLLVGAERLGAEVRSRPPTLLVHGSGDQVIPVQALMAAWPALADAGVPVEWHIRPGLAHGIDPEGLRLAGHFLRQHLGRRS